MRLTTHELLLILVLVVNAGAQSVLHGTTKKTESTEFSPEKRAAAIIDSGRASCDKGDRHWTDGDGTSAELAWKECFDELKATADSEDEAPVTRQLVRKYLEERVLAVDVVKRTPPGKDALAEFNKIECQAGDDLWADGKYVAAELAWYECLASIERRISELRFKANARKSLSEFVAEKRESIKALKVARVAAIEEEARKKEQLEKQQLEELRAQNRRIERLDWENMRKTPPTRTRTGAVPAILAYLNRNLHNPKSLEVVRWHRPVLTQNGNPFMTDEYLPYFWVVRVRYRARNGFNALMLTETDFFIRENRVVMTEPVR